MALSESDKALYGIISGPVHRDGCGHDPKHYICSFEWSGQTGEERRWFTEKIDLYVHDYYCGKAGSGQGLCLRFGSDDPDYYSGPMQICMSIDHDPYKTAFTILWRLGTFLWSPREEDRG